VEHDSGLGEHPEHRKCEVCGRSLEGRRRDSRWCSRACRQRQKRREQRLARLKGSYSAVHGQSLADLHDRARRPAHWADIEAGHVDSDLLEYSDSHDVGVYQDDNQDEDDEAGIVTGDSAPDPRQERDRAFAAQTALGEAIEQIKVDFDRRARPYLAQQRRNAGVIRPELAALMRERDNRIAELTRAHQLDQAYEWAAKDRPGRIVTAHDRAVEQAAARSLQADLGRGRHLRDDPADAGRDVHDTWIW
jgi:hypothetical protein